MARTDLDLVIRANVEWQRAEAAIKILEKAMLRANDPKMLVSLGREMTKHIDLQNKLRLAHIATGEAAAASASKQMMAAQRMVAGAIGPVLPGGRPFVQPSQGALARQSLALGVADMRTVRGGTLESQMANAQQAQTLARSVDGVGDAFGRTAEKGKFATRVLEAFFLYRGFVFLQQSLISITRQFVDLEHQISLSLTQLEDFGEGMRGAMTQGVLDTARETGLSFQVVAEGLYEVTSAGYSAGEALEALNTVSKAAVAGNVEIKTAFDAALTQMNVFGDEAGSLEQVLDKQFTAVRRGIFTYEQFATQVAAVSEAMFQAGQSIETTNAAMTAISQVFTGPQLARGATALRQFALAISSAPEKFTDVGIAVHTMDGDIRGLLPILEDMKVKFDGLTESERGKLIAQIIPDRREQQAVLALIENMDQLRLAYVEQQLALGTLDQAYNTVNEDIKVQAGQLKNSIQTGFMPMVGLFGELLGGLNKLERAMPGFVSTLMGLAAAATAAGLAFNYLNHQVVAGGPTRGANFMAGLRGPLGSGAIGSRITPLGIGAGIFGAAAGAGIAGRGDGFSAGGLLGSAALGAGMGAIGGLPGVAIGAAAGIISYSISAFAQKSGDAFEKGGATFADVFIETLKENKGDIEEAFSTALGLTGKDGGIPDLRATSYQIESVEDFRKFSVNRKAAAERFGLPEGSGGALLAGALGTGGAFFRDTLGINREGLSVKTYSPGPDAPTLAASLRSELSRFDEVGNAAVSSGAVPSSEVAESRRRLVERFLDSNLATEGLNEEQGRVQKTLRSLVPILANSSIKTEDFGRILDEAGGDALKFFQLLEKEAASAAPATKEIELASNSLADILFHASDVVRMGLVESANFTADELEMLGEEFADLNKVVKKIGLLKELDSIADFFGIDFDMEGLKKGLEDAAKVGGQSIKDLLQSDPTKLLDFIDTLIEFGDVNVDQSTQNNIVVRISGGTDLNTQGAAELADAIVRELDNRKRSGR